VAVAFMVTVAEPGTAVAATLNVTVTSAPEVVGAVGADATAVTPLGSPVNASLAVAVTDESDATRWAVFVVVPPPAADTVARPAVNAKPVTTTLMVFDRVAAPESVPVAVMVIGYVPVGTAAVVANVSVDVAPVFDGAIAAGAFSVMPDGMPVAVMATFAAYPESVASTSLMVPDLPCGMVTEFAAAVIV
jgi:hypothetical protein